MGLPRTPKTGKELDLSRTPKKADKLDKSKNLNIDDNIENSDTMEVISFYCKKCEEKLGEDENSVRCDSCKAWFHVICAKLTNKDLENITKLGEKTKWFCETCAPTIEAMLIENKKLKTDNIELGKQNQLMRKELENLKKDMNELKLAVAPIETNIHDKISEELDVGLNRMKSSLTDVGERIKNIERDNNIITDVFFDFEKKLSELKEELRTDIKEETRKIFDNNCAKFTKSNDNITQLERTNLINPNEYIDQIRKSVEDKFDDRKDKENRKCNLIFYNIKESNYSNQDRNADNDFEICSKVIYEEIAVESFTIMHMMRLGKTSNNDKPRPILIQFRTESEKWEILRKAKNLRHSRRYGIIYVSRDMTLAERKADKALREEMYQRREEGEDCFIKNGVVIPRNTNIRKTFSVKQKIRQTQPQASIN